MESVEIALANSLDEIPGLAEAVEAFGETHDLPPKLVFQLNLALEELVTNIVCHAYDDDHPHVIQVRLAVVDDMITAEVEDDGRPFDPFADATPPDAGDLICTPEACYELLYSDPEARDEGARSPRHDVVESVPGTIPERDLAHMAAAYQPVPV